MDSNETIFRFISIHEGVTSKEKQRYRVYCQKRNKGQTAIHKRLSAAKAENNEYEMYAICREFNKTPEYIDTSAKLNLHMQKVEDWVQENCRTSISNQNFSDSVSRLTGSQVSDIIDSPYFNTDWENITDTIITATIMKTASTTYINSLIRLLKIYRVIELFDEGAIQFTDTNVLFFLRKMQCILPDDIFPVPQQKTPPQNGGPGGGGGSPDNGGSTDSGGGGSDDSGFSHIPGSGIGTGGIAEKPQPGNPGDILMELKGLESAYKEVASVKQSVLISDINTNKIEQILSKKKGRAGSPFSSTKIDASPIDEAMVKIDPKIDLNTLTIPKETSQHFSPSTKNVLKKLNININEVNPKESKQKLKAAISNSVNNLLQLTRKKKILKVGGLVIDYDKLKDFLSGDVSMTENYPDIVDTVKQTLPSYVAGVGDLLLVKQKLKAYQLSDFAHVENVLAGESKERTHRRISTTEEEETYREETEETREKDLQSTDRHEMQNEAEKIIKNNLKIEAGLKVSGSYGPAVKYSANTSVGFNTSSEETKRKSSSFAKEVTEKTVESIKKKVIEERTTRVKEEIEEVNIHSIDNEGQTDHIVGVYRWLNKVYDAQIFNYGKRMMLEFVIPEPSANYLYAIIDSPPEGSIIPKPEEPMNIEETNPLKPNDIKEDNYQYWVSKYDVTNAPVPPEKEKTVVFHHSKLTNKDEDVHTASVEIPDGYQASEVIAHTLVWMPGEGRKDWWFCFYIGDARFYYRGGIQSASFNEPFTNQLAVTIRSYKNIRGYGVAAHIICEPTEEKLEQWRQDMYAVIMEAYWRQKSDYEEAMAAANISEGVHIVGRNPLENRRIEQNELKRSALSLLTRQEFDSFNSLLTDDNGWPRINFEETDKEGPYIRFFENAFEWNNITYVFYPYFWGQRNNWSKYLHFEDPDPDFAAFLKAGAARLQVPVRPGFESAVTYYIQNREIWEGEEAPVIGDEHYVSVTQEVAESLNAPDNAEPYSDPWEVILPTSLVVLQKLEQIPGIRDILTDNVITLGNENGGDDE